MSGILKNNISQSKKKKILIIIRIMLLVLFIIWLNNTNVFYSKEETYKFLAHRGLAQTYDASEAGWETNTAEIIHTPEHPYLENTIASMQAAFDYGADVVEFDVKLTKDNILAVFHDSTLEHRTDAQGEVGDYTMEELKKLDIGYGYTADHGLTFPFRGKGIGLMPTIQEVFTVFPDKDFLIHVKDGNIKTYQVLWDYLKEMPIEQLDKITVYGDNAGIKYLRNQSDSLRLLSLAMMKSALLKYELLGFTGYIPKELHNMELHLPLNYARFLWGWPQKFVKRMDLAGTRVVIVAGDGEWSEGFDTEKSLELIPDKYNGYVWTNRIDIVNE